MANKKPTPSVVVPRAQKGPSLTWNSERDSALVLALSRGNSRSSMVDVLYDDPAFNGVEPDAITELKIANRMRILRKQGVSLDKFSRSKYSPDVDELNALLA